MVNHGNHDKIILGTVQMGLDYGINNKNGKISFEESEKIKCDTLYQTVPSFNFLKLTKSENKSIKPILRKQKVIHFLVDKAPVKRPFWINFYDKNFISYRATLYDNFNQKNNSYFRISVELLTNFNDKANNLENRVFNELIVSDIIPKDSKKIWSKVSDCSANFPIYTTTYKNQMIDHYNSLDKQFDNLLFLGNRPEKKGGQIEILNQIFESL